MGTLQTGKADWAVESVAGSKNGLCGEFLVHREGCYWGWCAKAKEVNARRPYQEHLFA